MLYLITGGAQDPTGASIPLHLAANGSLEAGQDVTIVLAGDATELILDEHRELRGVGVPPLQELLTKLTDHGVAFHV